VVHANLSVVEAVVLLANVGMFQQMAKGGIDVLSMRVKLMELVGYIRVGTEERLEENGCERIIVVRYVVFEWKRGK
jgi:hypothetical protein